MNANAMHWMKWTVALVHVTPSHLDRCTSKLTTWSSATHCIFRTKSYFLVFLHNRYHLSLISKVGQISYFYKQHLPRWQVTLNGTHSSDIPDCSGVISQANFHFPKMLGVVHFFCTIFSDLPNEQRMCCSLYWYFPITKSRPSIQGWPLPSYTPWCMLFV